MKFGGNAEQIMPAPSETVYRLFNNFDPTTPPGWEEEAIARAWDEWSEWDESTDDGSIFWSRVFVTVIVLIVAAWISMNIPG